MIAASGLWAQVGVTITAPSTQVIGQPGVNMPVTFYITLTTTGEGVISIKDASKIILYCSPDTDIYATPFPLGDKCDSGNGNLTLVSVSGNVITYTVYPAKDCQLSLYIGAGAFTTSDDEPLTNEEDVAGPVVTYIDAPRTKITPISSDPTNDPNVFFHIEFSKAVSGFSGSDIEFESVSNAGAAGGTKTAVLTEDDGYSGEVFTVGVSGMTYPGRVRIYVPQDSATSDDQGVGNWSASQCACTVNSVVYDDVAPSGLALTRPDAGDGISVVSDNSATYTTARPIIDIAGNVTDDTSVARVTWSNDRGGSGTCTGTTSWAKNGIYLEPGTNVITITAYDTAGNSVSYTLSVGCTNRYWNDVADDGGSYGVTATLGLASSLKLDPDSGYPKVSYYDSTNGDLKYAAWDGTQWQVQTLDGSASNVGSYTSLALDSDGNPHIAYYDVTNTDLKYIYLRNGVWKSGIVDGSSGASDRVGTYCSLALDINGRPRIAYYDETNHDLLYAQGSAVNDPTWTIQTVDSVGDVGKYCSLALDSAGKPRISYYDTTNTALKYAEGTLATSPSFTITTVESANDVGQYSSLALDSGGFPRIAYYDVTNGDLRYAQGSAAVSPTWTIGTVDTTNSVGTYCSLVLDSDDKPVIGYYDSIDGNLKIAEGDSSEGPAWSVSILDDGQAEAETDTNDVGRYVSLVLDENDNPHLSYQDVTNNSLKYRYCIGNDTSGYPPSCTVTAPASPAISIPLTFTVAFSEDVDGFASTDVDIDNGYISGFIETTPNSVYRVEVTPYASGTVSCYVPGDAANSTSTGFGNLPSNTASASFVDEVPSVVVSDAIGQSDPTSSLPIHFAIIFSEPVYGLTADDIEISGTAGATDTVLDGGGSYYDLVIRSAAGKGSITVSVPANVATNAAGSGNTASASDSIWYDGSAPECTINQAGSQDDPTTDGTINYTAVFTEPVIGFAGSYTASDISRVLVIAGNAGFSSKQAVITPIGTADSYGHYSNYNVAVRGMSSSGTVRVSIPEGAAWDCNPSGVGINTNEESTSTDNVVQYYYSGDTAPSVLVNQATWQSDPTENTTIHFTAVFSEIVTGFTDSDVVLDGTAGATTASVTSTSGGTTYDIAVSGMIKSGTVIVTIPIGVAQDADGNGNKPSESTDNTVQYYMPLTVSVAPGASQSDPATTLPIVFTATFSKVVSPTDFTSSDIEVSGTAFEDGTTPTVTVSNADSTYKVYTISVSNIHKSGTVTVRIPGDVVTVDGFGNSASGTASVQYDAPAPTVEVNQAEGQADPTNGSVIHFTAVFSDTVTGFSSSGVTVSGAGADTVTITGSGTTYDIAVSGMDEFGVVEVNVNAGAAYNADNISNAASTSTDNEVTYDNVSPSVVVARATTQSTTVYDVSAVNFKVTFSEAVSGFASSDVVISGTACASTATITGSGAVYNVAVSGMTTDGTVTMSIPANVVTDFAGNSNTASTTDTTYAPLVTYYSTPAVTINQASYQDDPVQACPIYFTAVFNEPVTDFDDTSDLYIVKSDPTTLTGTAVPTFTETGPANNVGKYSFLTVDPSDNLHVSYFDSTANTLKYATGNAANSRWSTGIADAGGWAACTSLAVNGLGYPRISYYDMVDSDLKYAIWNGSRWDSQTVDEAGDVGQYTSLKLSSTGVPYISYYDATNTRLKYAYYKNSVWHCSVVDGGADADDNVGIHSSLALDASGRPRIAYYDLENGDLLYAEGSAAENPTWTIKTVDFSSYVGAYVSLALDSAGKPRISYYDEWNGNLKYAEGDAATNPTFTVMTVDDGKDGDDDYDVGQFSSLKLDSNGLPRISYYDATDNVLKYAQGNAASSPITWTIITADDGDPADAEDPGDDVGMYSSLILDSSDIPIISYYDATNGNLKYAYGDAAIATSFTDATMTDGTTYEIAVNGLVGEGTVTAAVPADVAADSAGIKNKASTSTDNHVHLDNQPPAVEISLANGQSGTTNVSPINFVVTFNETVIGFDADKVTVTGTGTGGTAAIEKIVTPIAAGIQYNVSVSGMVEGTVKLGVGAGVVVDTAGNANTASTTEEAGVTDTVLYDTTSPIATIDLADGQDDPTMVLPINFKVTLSEAVTSFTEDNVDISDSTVGDNLSVEVSAIDALSYSVTVDDASHSGSVIINIPVGSLQDAAGNYNVNAADEANIIDNEVVYDDQTNPTVTITKADGQADIVNTQPVRFEVVFSEPVTGFGDSADDVMISGTAGGTKTAIVTGSSATYTVSVYGMTSTGTVQIDIPEGAAADLSGFNDSEASDGGDNVVTYDIASPTVTMEPAIGQDNPTDVSPVHFRVLFSEAVSGFTSSDVTVSGTANPTTAVVTPGDGSLNSIYDVVVSGMTSSGFVAISIPAGAAYDEAGNASLDGFLLDQISYNWPGPSVTITKFDDQADPTNMSTIYFTVVFSTEVTGFEGSDVTLDGSADPTNAEVTSIDGAIYTVAVSGMSSSGDVTISIPMDSAYDLDGNGNVASGECTVEYDMDVPSVILSRAPGQEDSTRTIPISFKAVFSEPISGFTKSDVKLTGTAGGTKSITVLEADPLDKTTYTITVSGLTSAGTVIAQIPAGVVSDEAGNLNTVSSSVTVTYAWQPLTATLSLAEGQADPTKDSPINLVVVFSEAVTDFVTGDITLGGTAAATQAVITNTGDNKTYSVAISGMSKTGEVIAYVEADEAHNDYGDGNLVTGTVSVDFDGVAPTVAITSPTTDTQCTRNVNTVSIAGTASDDSGIANVKWSNSKGSNGECSGTTSWSTGDITITSDGDDSYSETITITVTDTAGNKATDSLIVNVLERTPSDDIWTDIAMVSLPIIPDETDPKMAVGFYSNSWAMYDTLANEYVMYPDEQTYFDPANETPGRGFWVRFGSTRITPTGMIPSQESDATIHLYAGWNIIGNPFVSNVTWDPDAIKVSYSGHTYSLSEADDLVGNYAWGWDPEAGSYYLVYDKTEVSDAVGVLAPWQAFWVKAEAECDLVLPAP
ncbi:Ig-like domain-containing protein [bacterium]|nr:Ig-like domain-containing protein [bacterium]